MQRLFALLSLITTLSGCEPTYEDAWRYDAKYRPGDLVVFRIDGRTAMVLGARYDKGANKFTYLVKDPKLTGPHPVEAYEIAKAPQRTCKDSESTNDWLAYQEGDKAAEARCRRG